MANAGRMDELFNVRWNNYTSVIQSVFQKLLDAEKFVDVTLACEGKSLKCHRVILSACSSYFEQLFTDNPNPNLVIYMKDMKYWEMQALVSFMYNGEVSVSHNDLKYLVKAAESLKIKGLASTTGGAEGQDAQDGLETDEPPKKRFADQKMTSKQNGNSGQQLQPIKRKLPQLFKMQNSQQNDGKGSTSPMNKLVMMRQDKTSMENAQDEYSGDGDDMGNMNPEIDFLEMDEQPDDQESNSDAEVISNFI